MGTDIAMLVIGNAVLHKKEQDPALKVNDRHQFELD